MARVRYVFSYVKICFAQKRRIKNRIILRKISRRGDETQSENSERSNFSEFCERTSLHGWQHIHRVNTRKGRIVWLSIVLASLSVALLFLTTATKDFANRAVVTTIETTTASLQVSSKKGDYIKWVEMISLLHLQSEFSMRCFLNFYTLL